MLTLYGIPNCDTVKKARRWLDNRGVAYRFHDLRKDGLEAELLRAWVTALGWEVLVNRRGTTWRGLPQGRREALDEAGAMALMLEHPTLIKRPVAAHAGGYLVGFDAGDYERLAAGHAG